MAKTTKVTELKAGDKAVGGKLIKAGLGMVLLAVVLFLMIFYPVLIQELKYLIKKPAGEYEIIVNKGVETDEHSGNNEVKVIEPIDPQFSIIVPKISANARIIANVDPQDSKVYQWELTKGVAHAAGTAFPDQKGNTFLFAHSSDNFYNANRYNAVFYLLNKLNRGDEFVVVYEGEKYVYTVVDEKLVPPEAVEYFTAPLGDNKGKTATLMTCWPPGTTLNRLVLVGEFVGVE